MFQPPEAVLENAARSLCFHEIWCVRIPLRPEVMKLPLDWLARMRATGRKYDERLRVRWEDAAGEGVGAFVALARLRGDEGDTLRSNSPFGMFWWGAESVSFLDAWNRRRRSGMPREEAMREVLEEWSPERKALHFQTADIDAYLKAFSQRFVSLRKTS